MFDPYEWDAIDWDDPDDEDGNLVHCLRHEVSEITVFEVLREHPVEIRMALQTAEFAIVGPDQNRSEMWTILFDHSYKRGDWLRPITGWRAKPQEVVAWRNTTRLPWKNSR